MNEIQHPFERIRIWSDLPNDELLLILNGSETMDVLSSAIELLMDNPIELSQYPVDAYPKLIKKLNMLIKTGSWELGDAIIKSDDFTKSGNIEKAIDVIKSFISSCDSPFYRKTAKAHLNAVKRKF